MSKPSGYRDQPERCGWLPAVTVASAIIAIGVACFAYRLVEQQFVAIAGNGLARSAAHLAGFLERTLSEHALHIRMIAQAPSLREERTETLNEYLRAVQAASPFYLWIGVTDANGRVRFATDSSSLGRLESGVSWPDSDSRPLSHASEARGVEVQRGGRRAIALEAPVHDAQGRFMGAVKALIGFQAVQSVLGRVGADPAIQGPAGSLEYRLLASDGSLLFDSSGRVPEHHNLRRSELPSAILSMSAGSGFVEEEHPWRHVPVITGYARVAGDGALAGLQWGVLVSLDQDKVVRPLRKKVWPLMVGGSLLVVPLLGGFLLVRKRAALEHAETAEQQVWLSAVGQAVGEGVIATDDQGRVGFLNTTAQALTGWKEDEARGKALPDVLTIVHEETRRAEESPFVKAAREGRMIQSVHATRLIARDGTERPIEYKCRPIVVHGGALKGVVVAFKERSERRSAAGVVFQNGRPGEAGGEDRFCDASLWDLIKRWVRAAEVNRVCVFENHFGEDGSRWASRRYEWIGLGAVARTERSQWFSWSMRAKGFSRWEEKLGSGEALYGAVRKFPDAERAALASCGIKSILVMPVFVQQTWWGFIEFDHCLSEREWTEAETQGLMAAAHLLAAAIASREPGEELQRLLARLDAALESTADGLLVVDGQGTLIGFNQRLAAMWRIPNSVAESRSIEEIVGWMMGQLKAPELLLRTVSELDDRPGSESYDILELKDGRMFERFSRPRCDGRDYAGRVWSFREITEDQAVRYVSVGSGARRSIPSGDGSREVETSEKVL